MDDNWYWSWNTCLKETPVCKTTECEDVKNLRIQLKHAEKMREERRVYAEELIGKLDDERDKSQKLQVKVRYVEELRDVEMGRFKADNEELQKENEELREANKIYVNICSAQSNLKEENKKLKESIDALSNDLMEADDLTARLVREKEDLKKEWMRVVNDYLALMKKINEIKSIVNRHDTP